MILIQDRSKDRLSFEERLMYAKAITALLLFVGGTYASSSVLEDFLKGTMDMVAIHAATAEMRMVHGKFTEFRIANNRYPSQQELFPFLEQEFETALENTRKDPWANYYLMLGPEVEMRCKGPDAREKTRDDLVVEYPRGIEPPDWTGGTRNKRTLTQ